MGGWILPSLDPWVDQMEQNNTKNDQLDFIDQNNRLKRLKLLWEGDCKLESISVGGKSFVSACNGQREKILSPSVRSIESSSSRKMNVRLIELLPSCLVLSYFFCTFHTHFCSLFEPVGRSSCLLGLGLGFGLGGLEVKFEYYLKHLLRIRLNVRPFVRSFGRSFVRVDEPN